MKNKFRLSYTILGCYAAVVIYSIHLYTTGDNLVDPARTFVYLGMLLSILGIIYVILHYVITNWERLVE
jgi:cyanophycinase-like exopeptidase